MKENSYWIMDGRALLDIDSATVLCTSNTLEEAVEDEKMFDDCCIVEVSDKGKRVMWDEYYFAKLGKVPSEK